MLKPNSLRQHLAEAVPTLQRDPDRLAVFIRDGKLVTTGAGSLSFEYRYTLNLVLLDYGEHADAVMVPLLAWLRLHQPEIANNPELREKAVRFEVEILNASTVDLSIEVDLSERVLVQRRAGTAAFDVRHVAEPPVLGETPTDETVEIFFEGHRLASWSYPPAP